MLVVCLNYVYYRKNKYKNIRIHNLTTRDLNLITYLPVIYPLIFHHSGRGFYPPNNLSMHIKNGKIISLSLHSVYLYVKAT